MRDMLVMQFDRITFRQYVIVIKGRENRMSEQKHERNVRLTVGLAHLNQFLTQCEQVRNIIENGLRCVREANKINVYGLFAVQPKPRTQKYIM